mgnify:FL=1
MTLNVNVRNLILLTDALSDSLKSRKGNVVNISSVSASTGSIGQIAYSASKGAVNSMTRNMSIDLGRAGVRVNAVAPGVIDDGMWTTAFESGAVDREKTMAGISKVILAGMSSNLCTESHMRSLIEQGFEVMVVTDATAGAITPFYNGYDASLTNFRMIASKVDNTANTVSAIEAAYRP